MEVFTEIEELKPGWYAVGVQNLDFKVDWDSAPILQYLGQEQWADEEGKQVVEIWDPVLQHFIDINIADEYILQNRI